MARVLVQKKIQKAIRNATSTGETPDNDNLAPGHMRLYGFYKPSLEAGLYGIEAKQNIIATGNDPLPVWNYKGEKTSPLPPPEQQLFSVAAPQFNLDSKLINTFYPPSGHQDEGRILPHMVFSDPHIPWLRRSGLSFPDPLDPDPTSADPKLGRNMVPWMAIIVFDTDELIVPPTDAASTGLTSIASYIPDKLPADGAFPMDIGEYLSKVTSNRIYYEAGYTEPAAKADWDTLKASTDRTSVIFPTKSRVQEMFGKDNLDTIESLKFLAHVRNVNTIGFPDAGVEEEGSFSVVISCVTGNVKTTTPVTQVAHLVSIEHLDSTITDKNSPFHGLVSTDRIGLISLFSWVYTAIPEAANFVQVIKDLAAHMQPIKPQLSVLQSLQDSIANQPTLALKSAAQSLHNRLNNSYTLCRWRTATGEETVAFNRGPLVSAPTSDVPSSTTTNWPVLSMSGKDYQIFDDSIGVMDTTYSSAWSLGRLTAISDSPFNAALLRFRSLVWQQSASNTRLAVNNISSAKALLSRVSASVKDAHAINPSTFSGSVARINPPSTDSVAPPLSHPDVAPVFTEALQRAIDANASTDDGEKIYSDFHLASAANSDWELIHNWISNCLYLAKIPAHYLFPEPAHIQGQPESSAPSSIPNLPPEALRFFFIDHAWLDCFIDGALSCANHLEPQFDSTRLRIKEVYNFYLRSTIHPLEGQTPPIPRSGFIIRSSVVKAIPDLKVTVTARTWDGSAWIEDTNRDPVVQITKMDDFTILCLLDCLPQEMFQVAIAQPPHQQRFAMGASLKPDLNNIITPEVEVRMLYTNPNVAPEGTGAKGMWNPATIQPPATDQPQYYNSETRVVNSAAIAKSVNKALLDSSASATPAAYEDQVPDSCVLGLELNDPSYQLSIDGPSQTEKGPLKPWVRQLWTGSLSTTFQLNAPMSTKSGLIAPQARLAIQFPPLPTLITTGMHQTPATPKISRLNSTRIVPKPLSEQQESKVAIASNPMVKAVGIINGPQFTVVLHPDYRPPPPTPYQALGGGNIYAPGDFLPTDTNNLFDLIIAIRRIKPASAPGYKLVEIDVELPISDGTDAKDKAGNIREPLIEAGGYSGGGVRMTSNHRFVPTLYTSTDRFDKTVLGIRLIPRSGDPTATLALLGDDRTSDASVRLSECPIAAIVDSSKGVQVAQVDSTGKGTSTSAREPRGICKILLREVYLLDTGNKTTVTTDGSIALTGSGVPLWVLKRAGGDVDLNGNPV